MYYHDYLTMSIQNTYISNTKVLGKQFEEQIVRNVVTIAYYLLFDL